MVIICSPDNTLRKTCERAIHVNKKKKEEKNEEVLCTAVPRRELHFKSAINIVAVPYLSYQIVQFQRRHVPLL